MNKHPFLTEITHRLSFAVTRLAIFALLCLAGNVAAQTAANPLDYIYEDFTGTGTPTGWTYDRFSRTTQSYCVDGSACLLASISSSYPTASVTTSYVAMGANPVLSFKYKATTSSYSTAAADNALQYTVSVSTDGGTTWKNILTDVNHVSSADFVRIPFNLSTYARQTVRVQITFRRITDAYVWLDEVALGTVPPIFSGVATLAAGTVYNNYSSPLSINTRTYSIANKGSQPLTISDISTTGGVTVTGLSGTLSAFGTKTITVEINASSFQTYDTYSGSFAFSTNAPGRPTATINVTGDVRAAPNGDHQNFSGTGTPTGWTYDRFSRTTQSYCVDGSACLLASISSSYPTASVTTSYVAMGANPVLSFKYKATTSSYSTAAADNALQYTVSVSADGGATWTNVLTDGRHVSSANFATITTSLPASYTNQIVSVRITFTRVNDAYVWLDDVEMGSGYKVTFDANDGYVTPTYGTTGAGGGTLPSLPTPTRNGYTFNGWFTAATGGTTVTENRGYYANTTIYAHWTLNTYTITFNANGGTVTPTTGTTGEGWMLSSLPTPTRSGYTFNGWFTAATGGSAVTESRVYSADATIYAQWTLNIYTITLDANGGSVNPTSSTTSGTFGFEWKLTSLPTPIKEDYFFDGWFTATTGGNKVTTSTVFNDNTTIYAQWSPIYTVTFDANGGNVTPESSATGSGGKLTSLPTPTREGYAFNGWFTAATGGTAVTVSTVFSTDATIYAQWTSIYTVTFNANGGSVTPAFSTTGAGGKLISLPTPTKTGYTFNGWFREETGGTKVTANTVFDTDATIYAQWILGIYTITFNANGGSVTPATGTTGQGWKLSSLPVPTRTGYNFGGWFTAETGGTAVTTNTTFSENTTIYARWSISNPTFIFEGFSGTSTPAGWTYSNFSRQTYGSTSSSAYLRVNLYSSRQTASVTIPNVTLGENGSLGFSYGTPNYSSSASAGDGGGTQTISVSIDGGTTWTNVRSNSFSSFLSSNTPGASGGYSYYPVSTGLSAYANQTVTVRITFTWTAGNFYVWLDDIALVGAIYTVTFDANGGTVSSTSSTTGTTSATVRKLTSLPTPTKAGYAFNGWFTAVTGGTQVTTSTEYSASTLLYAQWTPTYTVTYDANGGEVTPASGTTGTGGTLTSLPTPTRSGYTFNGWYTAATGGTAVTTSMVFSANTTIYAQWTLNTYTITFNANGGTVFPTSGTTGEGWKLSSLPTPTRNGYTFNGWYTAATGGTAVTTSTVFSANTTIYARWTLITYAVTFDANGGEVTPASGTTGIGGTLTSLPTPTRSGYTFNGWYTAETGGTQVTVNTAFNTDATIYTQWKLNTYTITFKDHDGTELKTQTVEHGSAATAPTHHTREGHTFTSWDKAFDNVTSNLTVTAEYDINTYTITFKDHDGTELKTQTVEHGSAATAPTHHTKEGHTFTSWDKAFSNVMSDLTVTAEYDINTYTVTFKDHDGKTLKTETVEHGSAATTPEDPTRAGYTFTSWDKAFDNVTSNLTVTAEYEEITPILSPKTAKGNLLTPTQNGITLTANTNATVAVYSMSGKLISRQNYNAGNHSISFGYLPKGMYIVKASHGSEKQILRVAVK